MNHRATATFFVLVLLTGLLAGCGSKQESAGINRISGRVVGVDGAGVAGATVMARRGQVLLATTDNDGKYSIPAAVGPYTLTATKRGFVPTGMHPTAVMVWDAQTAWAPDLHLEPKPAGVDNVTIATLRPSLESSLTTGDEVEISIGVQYMLKSASSGVASLLLYFPNTADQAVQLASISAPVTQGAGEVPFFLKVKVPYTTGVFARVEMRSSKGELLALNELGSYSVTGEEPSAPTLAVNSKTKSSLTLTWSGGNLADSQYLELYRGGVVLARLDSNDAFYEDDTVFDGTSWLYKLCLTTQAGDEYCGNKLLVDMPLVGVDSRQVSSSWGTMVYDENSDLIYMRSEAGDIIAIDPLSGNRVQTYAIPSSINALAVSGDGSTIATVNGHAVCAYKLTGGTSSCVGISGTPSRIALDRTGEFLYLSNYENQVQRIDISDGTVTYAISYYHSHQPLQLSADDSLLFIGAHAFDAADLTSVDAFGNGYRTVLDPGGAAIYSSGTDRTTMYEAREPWSEIGFLEGAVVAVSPDISRLYVLEKANGGLWVRTFKSNGLAWTKSPGGIFIDEMVPEVFIAEKSNQKLYIYCRSSSSYDDHYLLTVDLVTRASAE